MSIVNYLINLEEMALAIKESFQSEKLFNLGSQRVYGLELEVNADDERKATWKPNKETQIVGIKYGVNDCRNIGYTDSFDMYVDGEIVFEDVYIKEMYEYKRFRQHRQLMSNSIVEFVFKNRDKKKKHIWFDIHYTDKDIEAKVITIICVNKDTGEEIQRSEMLVKPPFSGDVIAPTIDNYTVVGNDKYNVNIPLNTGKNTELIFEYEEIKEDIPEIDHDFDWMIKMSWQSNCLADLDLHALFDNGDLVSYKNVEIGSGNNKAWLDFDYTSHSGGNDEFEKPEIITILGKISNMVDIQIDPYSGGDAITKDVKIEISRFNNNKLEVVKTYALSYDKFHHETKVNVCRIDLSNKTVTDL